MAELRQEIIEWLHNRPNWMQEAAERILLKGELSDTDVEEIALLLQSEEGQKISNHRIFTGLSNSQTSNQTLRLLSIGYVKGIDKLAPRVPLSFGSGSLIVIYGHNGSGKSGYSRILKRACGKPRADKLKSNVFDKEPLEQGCTIEFEVNGKSKKINWNAKKDHLSELESVDIFDGDEAGFYLMKETNVSYTPLEVLLFEKLAAACDRVKSKLQEKQAKLLSKIPNLPPKYSETKTGKKYTSITTSISIEELSSLTEWSKAEDQRLNQIKERLKEKDPLKLALSKRKKKDTINQIISDIKTAYSIIDQNAIENYKVLLKTASEKRKAATEGAEAQTQSAKLEGIGTETWRALWEAARAYSKIEAFPKKDFPVVEEARCVLCHQKLIGEAPQRLKDFELFVKGKLETDAKTAEENLRKAVENLPSIPENVVLAARIESAGIDDQLSEKIMKFWADVAEKVAELKKVNPDSEYNGLNSQQSIIESLKVSAEEFHKEEEQHELDANGFDRKKTEEELLELETKLWISQQKVAIKEELKRLKKRKHFDDLINLTNSRAVSLQAGRISEKAITEAYVQRFNMELEKLGADRIQVELVKTRTNYGKTLHQIRLKDVEQEGNSSITVLSDGERRIVALAAFLSDVIGRPKSTPFIFDDPISSLDHDFEWEVAMRLANLATTRQVIILTHRLSFYGVLEEAEKKIRNDLGISKKNLEQRCIESFSGSTGHPADQQAWSQNTKTANNTLVNRLGDAKKFWDSGNSNSYKIHAQAICSDFRKLIERSVEDDLLHEIVKRHRRSVMTQNKLNSLVTIKKEDCNFIDRLMTKYSKFEHSQSHEMPVEVPGEPDLRKDLEALKSWREEFKKRAP